MYNKLKNFGYPQLRANLNKCESLRRGRRDSYGNRPMITGLLSPTFAALPTPRNCTKDSEKRMGCLARSWPSKYRGSDVVTSCKGDLQA